MGGGWVAGAGGSRWRATLRGPSAGIQRRRRGGGGGEKMGEGGAGRGGTAPKVPAGIRRDKDRGRQTDRQTEVGGVWWETAEFLSDAADVVDMAKIFAGGVTLASLHPPLART